MLARQLEEAVADGSVPWDLHEAYGVKAGDDVYVRRRGKEPKYTGLIGPRYEAAIAKGYLDLGLLDPSVARERTEGRWFIQTIAAKVGYILMKEDVAFIRDPENLLAIYEIDPKRIAPEIARFMEAHFSEEESYAVEADEMDRAQRLARASQEAARASVTVQPVTGKTGAGYKIVMRPTFNEISARAR